MRLSSGIDVDGRIKFRSVETSEWLGLHEPTEYPPEFVRFIDSILADFDNISYYRPFELYKMQAKYWLDNQVDKRSIKDKDEWLDYLSTEKNRCSANTLYYANRYGYLKDGDAPDGSGKVKFRATKAQQIVYFLLDSKYSAEGLKGRQIGFTSAMGIAAGPRMMYRPNYFLKYIACDKEKGEEIFNDKVKDPLYLIEKYMVPSIVNNSKNSLLVAKKTKNKRKSGSNSRMKVDTPKVNAINGGSPQEVWLDEIGLLSEGLYAKMKLEGRPTMYFYNPEDGTLKLRRQLFAWGTAGEMGAGGGTLEKEFKAALKAWIERDFSYGVIPLFFSWKARVGATKEIYEAEKRAAYITGDKEKIVQFHQAWPDTIEDCFLRNTRTLIPLNDINKNLADIYSLPSNQQPVYGRFEPVYDHNFIYPDSFKVPYRIIGAEFIPTSGPDDPMTTAVMSRKPEPWTNRYFQGIDPINTETGYSKFSSSIYDKVVGDWPCLVNYREDDYQMCYVQSLLQRIYYSQYDPFGALSKTLIEANIGSDLKNFWKMLGVDDVNIIMASELPINLRSGGKDWGISNSPKNAADIIAYMKYAWESAIHINRIPVYPLQFKSFAEKDVKSQNGLRQTRWQAQSQGVDYDDALFSSAFAFIASEVDKYSIPKEVREIEREREIRRSRKLRYIPGVGNVYRDQANKKSGF